jgi:hypothetical protein
VKAKPSLTLIKELRQVYVLTDRYKINVSNDKISNQSLFQAMMDENWSACLDNAKQGLEANYISLNNHYKAMVCSLESGDTQQSHYHESVLNLLLEAIWATGNGESMATAFFSTSTAEINAFIEFHGLEITSRSLIQSNDKVYDVVTIKDLKSGKHFDWYFDISTQQNVLKTLTKN